MEIKISKVRMALLIIGLVLIMMVVYYKGVDNGEDYIINLLCSKEAVLGCLE